jgi:aspartate-semialdehyde dehydrogenase
MKKEIRKVAVLGANGAVGSLTGGILGNREESGL